MRSLRCYEEIVENAVGTFILDVNVFEDELYLSLNGHRKEKNQLYHDHYDALSFGTGYLDYLKREMWPKTYPGHPLLEFISNEYRILQGLDGVLFPRVRFS